MRVDHVTNIRKRRFGKFLIIMVPSGIFVVSLIVFTPNQSVLFPSIITIFSICLFWGWVYVSERSYLK